MFFCVHFWFFGEHCPELSKLFKAIFIFAEIKCWQKDQIEVYLEASNYNGYGVSCQGAADGFINVEVSGGIEEEIDDDYYGELIYYFTWYKDNLIYSTPFSNVSNGWIFNSYSFWRS